MQNLYHARIWKLVSRKLASSITQEEMDELEYLRIEYPNELPPMELLEQIWEMKSMENKDWIEHKYERYNECVQSIDYLSQEQESFIPGKEYFDDIEKRLQVLSKPKPAIHIQWVKYAAAILLIVGSYWVFHMMYKKDFSFVKQRMAMGTDILPASNKAILQLADGNNIILDSAASGLLAEEGGNTQIEKTKNGELVYRTKGSKPASGLYNTVSTPRGGQYKLILSDGTQVWLNASSSIKFPTAFTEKERKVFVTGEVYFEVAKLKNDRGIGIPFKVDIASKGQLEVLGTHFNISAYQDDNDIQTTLLEGSVKMTTVQSQNAVTLIPGEQVSINRNGSMLLNKNVNIEKIMAWRNGLFYFENESLQEVMEQISRWYDVDVEYKSEIKRTFVGELQRNLTLDQVFKILQKNDVKFVMEGRIIVVMK